MAITAGLVKELRQRTGAGMMECKKALTETDGDMDKAIEVLRTSGQAKADNKAGRIAAEGLVSVHPSDDGKTILLLEVNCETDFVAKGDDFQGFCTKLGALILANNPADIAALEALEMDGESVDTVRRALIQKTGENIQLRRFYNVKLEGECHACYIHNQRIAVVVDMQGGSEELAKDIAMHIAASKPQYLNESDVPAEALAKEKEILSKQAAQEDKPAEIIEKMVEGRLKKYLKEITLLGQAFVKDPDKTVSKVLDEGKATILSFQRYEIGEGIEKKKDDFVEEVMAQARGS